MVAFERTFKLVLWRSPERSGRMDVMVSDINILAHLLYWHRIRRVALQSGSADAPWFPFDASFSISLLPIFCSSLLIVSKAPSSIT